MKSLILVFLCASSFAAERPEVTGRMRVMFNSLMNLQPFLLSAERYSDPKNRKTIDNDLKVLSTLDHAFPKSVKSEEPGVALTSRLFSDYLKDARVRFNRGDYEYSRFRMKSTGAFCFQCHSRLTTEKSFVDLEKRVQNAGFAKHEKADFYAMTRQFDEALKTYQALFSETPKDEMELIHFTRGLRRALSLTVKVKRSPQMTLDLLNSVGQRKDLPEFIRAYTVQWKKDAEAWQSEGSEKLDPPAMVAKAKSLIERAASLHSFPEDENGDISYLRATNLLHEALEAEPKGKFRGEALYLLGLASGALQDPNFWDMDRLYFENCIREVPKSALAKKCYRRYSDRLHWGYTGSAGTFIPEEELEKLLELRKLSE